MSLNIQLNDEETAMRSVRSTTAVVGATLVFAVIAALSLSLGSSGAGATGLTLQHALISIAGIGVLLAEGYTPEAVLTGDSYFSDQFVVAGGDPAVPNVSLAFDVTLLTADSHLAISNVAVTLPSGCEITFHPAFLLNLNGALSFHANLSINGTTQTLYANCTSGEIGLVRAALLFGSVLVSFVTAH